MSSFRKFLHRRRLEYHVLRRRIYEMVGNPKYSRPARDQLDEKLQEFISFPRGFFIEVGANDGYAQSNTYFLEKFQGWHGVLIEPIPELYKRCKKKRQKSFVYNCALVSSDFQDTSIEIHYANLMSVVEGSLKTVVEQEQHIKSGLDCQQIEASYSIRVPARTLESILDEFPYPKIDFFSLDVEGYEIEVLKGLNLDKYRPQYILVEGRYIEEVDKFLAEAYEFVQKLSSDDYLYRCKS